MTETKTHGMLLKVHEFLRKRLGGRGLSAGQYFGYVVLLGIFVAIIRSALLSALGYQSFAGAEVFTKPALKPLITVVIIVSQLAMLYGSIYFIGLRANHMGKNPLFFMGLSILGIFLGPIGFVLFFVLIFFGKGPSLFYPSKDSPSPIEVVYGAAPQSVEMTQQCSNQSVPQSVIGGNTFDNTGNFIASSRSTEHRIIKVIGIGFAVMLILGVAAYFLLNRIVNKVMVPIVTSSGFQETLNQLPEMTKQLQSGYNDLLETQSATMVNGMKDVYIKHQKAGLTIPTYSGQVVGAIAFKKGVLVFHFDMDTGFRQMDTSKLSVDSEPTTMDQIFYCKTYYKGTNKVVPLGVVHVGGQDGTGFACIHEETTSQEAPIPVSVSPQTTIINDTNNSDIVDATPGEVIIKGTPVAPTKADTIPTYNGKTVGALSFRHGKVAQHFNLTVQKRESDPDGRFGALEASDVAGQLAYCKKRYPMTKTVQSIGPVYIHDWKAAGNTGSYPAELPGYACLQ